MAAFAEPENGEGVSIILVVGPDLFVRSTSLTGSSLLDLSAEQGKAKPAISPRASTPIDDFVTE